jgi:hypothetical protein
VSDSFGYTPGEGELGAADRIGGLLFQRVKLTFGEDGTADDVSAAAPLPVSAAALPLPAGAATEATLADLDAKVPALSTRVLDNESSGVPVRPIGQEVWTSSFSNVGASVISPEFIAPIVGAGVGYSQAAGALLITTGTTTNAEFLTRSVVNWRGAMRLRFSFVASQRIVNQNFMVALADLIGAGLSFSIVSAVLVDVTKAAHGFTAQNVGQFVFLGGIAGAAGVPGRYAIQSIPDANTIRLTVAGWPASGTGTLTAFGHSHVKVLYNGTTVTASLFDAQRRGWASGDTTLANLTSATPGHIVAVELTGREAFIFDKLRASSATPAMVSRGSRDENLPDDNLDLHLFLWSYNGTVAPASTTTWTVSVVSVEKYANTPVYLQGVRPTGSVNPLAIAGNVVASGTVTANIGTGSLAAGVNAIGDVGIQARANATGASTAHHFVAAASTNTANIKASAGRVLGWSLANTTAAWKYVKLHNSAGVPTAGAGVVMTIGVPPNGVAQNNIPSGVAFATGIARSCVNGAADADTTVVVANDVVGDIFFA